MNWYKKSNILNDSIDEEFADDDLYENEVEEYENQAWTLAYKSEINILSNKELSGVSVSNGELQGALWTSWDREGAFSFDVIVDPKHRGKGIGNNLVDRAIEIFNLESVAYENPHYEIDVVNTQMVNMLIKRGFKIVEKIKDHIIMTLE